MQQSYIIFKLWIPVFLLEQWTLQSSTTFSTLAIVFCISTWKHSQSFNFTFNLLLFHCSWLWSDSFGYIQSFHFGFYTVSQIHAYTCSYRFCLYLDQCSTKERMNIDLFVPLFHLEVYTSFVTTISWYMYHSYDRTGLPYSHLALQHRFWTSI